MQNTVRCSRNTFIFLLFHISLFFTDVPHPLSLGRFLFCCCYESTGLVRCLQDFANVLSIANVFAMFAKMFVWIRNLFLRSWVADFCVDILIIQLQKRFAKMFYHSAHVQKCLQICKSVQKCLQKKIFLWGG